MARRQFGALARVTAPVQRPVMLQEAKDHLRVDGTTEDAYIDALIEAATDWVESYTRRALVTQTWDWKLDAFPERGAALEVPKPPLQSVTSISYIDGNGDSQTWAAGNYRVDSDSIIGRITEAYGVSWPSTREVTNAVTVRFVCGYGEAADVPQAIKQAIYLILAELYERREQAVVGTIIARVPLNAEALAGLHKVYTL